MLIAAGRELFFRTGVNGSGVGDIAAAAGVPKGSFYNYFQTKETFVSEVLADYWRDIESRLAPVLLEPETDPLERIVRFFDLLTEEHGRFDFRFGCLIGNLALELAQASDDVRDSLEEIIARWRGLLLIPLVEAKQRGLLSSSVAPEEAATLLIESWEGAAIHGKVFRSALPYERFRKTLLRGLTA
jgi:TetR/AcrR family transcriptional repressor of nem operon